MSISKMKRLTVFARKEHLDELVKKLVRLRCVEISKCEDDPECEELALARINCDAKRSELEDSLGEIENAITLLNPYVKKSKGLFAQKKQVDTELFVNGGGAERAKKVVLDTIKVSKTKEKNKEEISKCEAQIVAARPYVDYDIPIGFSGTEHTDVFLGILPAYTDLDKIGKELYDAGAVGNVINMDKNAVYASFFCHKSNSNTVNSILSLYGFLPSGFVGEERNAKEIIREEMRKLKFLRAECDKLDYMLTKLAEDLDSVEALYDVEATELVEVNEKLKLATTDSVAIVNAWIPARREASVDGFLEKFECAYEIREPEGEEVPPILLQNNGFATNFEWVLGMYSYPVYGRFDPTFIMSIFYFFIFGVMFADVGYGLLLVLGCFGAVKFLHPSQGLKRSLKMFGYCGISCVLFGVLFGSYFGDLPLAIMRNFMGIPEDQLPRLSLIPSLDANLALIMDPLANPMGFLIVALGIGVVHLVAGMAVNFYILCRDGKVWDAIFDIGLYWVLFAGIGLLFLLPDVGMYVALGAAILIVLTHGRGEKNIFMKFGKGLLGLYDLINYASDLLSYSRILALGLSASIIGQVVNILGTMMGPTIPGFIMLVLVFLLGHTLNLAINVLGTFVHTARLQYIEFFGKFYEDGGIPFEPAAPSEKYTERKNNE